MSTNYYVKSDTCECCGHTPDQAHIGKSSAGWTFTFQAYRGLTSWKDWKRHLEDQTIVDEYDREVTLEEFKALVESKKSAKYNHTIECLRQYPEMREDLYLDSEGHSFSWREFS